MAVSQPCPAKVNLFLEVTGKKRDGGHTLAALFAKISLFDVVGVEESKEGFQFEIIDEVGQGLESGEDNFVVKAARAFAAEFDAKLDVKLTLTKRIPMGAGLGGGSSDAAGTLAALSRYYHLKPDRFLLAKLKKIGARLGADVPFFLRPEPMVDGRGVGEKLTPLNAPKALPWMVLVFPGRGVSTPAAFGRLALPPSESVLTTLSHLDKLKKKIEKGKPISEWKAHLFNRLEEAVLDRHPEVRQAKNILGRAGLEGVLMSGSGASVFGFASSHPEGERVVKRLRGYPWKVFLTSCLG